MLRQLGLNVDEMFQHLGETLPTQEVKAYFQAQARARKEASSREVVEMLQAKPEPYAGPSDAFLGGALASLAVAIGTTAVFGMPVATAPGLM